LLLSLCSILQILCPQEAKPEGASVPALGLSNKAVFAGEAAAQEGGALKVNSNEQYPDVYFNPLHMNRV
jgi:elongator complex protein 2